MERNFPRHLTALDDVFQFVHECMAYYNIAEHIGFSIKFIIEELFTNMVKYSKPSKSEIIVKIERDNGSCLIMMSEEDVDMFDMTRIPDVDVNKPIEDRQPGGLGLFLIRKMVERFDYNYLNRRSQITIMKNLE